MNKQAAVGAIIGALIVAVVGLVFNSVTDTYKRGDSALTEDEIRKVLDEKLVTQINGETKTYGEALSLISTKQAIMEEALKALAKD